MAEDSSNPEWTDDDLMALIGLPVRYEGRDDWVVTGRSSIGQAAEITNSDDDVAYIGPATVLVGEACLLSAIPVARRNLLDDWLSADALQETRMMLLRLQLVNSQQG